MMVDDFKYSNLRDICRMYLVSYDYKGQVESTHFAGNQHGECNGGMCLMFDVLGSCIANPRDMDELLV